MQKLTVNAPTRTYDILVDWDFMDQLGRELSQRGLTDNTPVAVITSPRIGGLYFESVRDSLRSAGVDEIGRLDIPDGEENKNLEQYCRAVNWLSEFADSPGVRPPVITLGGGVVGDLGGFVAHTFKRGVPFVQVTTTLLGAVDCSVGGKTAVDLPAGKNLVGAFHQPSLVFADLAMLRTLPEREIRSGTAEVIKYGTVFDSTFFEFLEDNIEAMMLLDSDVLARVVRRCCELKADVVARDEFDDRDIRISLNFGHTAGHAIESACGFRLTHGECVAIGMVVAARISRRLDMCSEHDAERLEKLLGKAGLPVHCRELSLDVNDVMGTMKQDKKWAGGHSVFVLLDGIGGWQKRVDLPMEVVREEVQKVLK
jgi:3-dehydroquinate synthase